ncbi:MAG: hypothetical protein NT013_06395 [Planctomycetia bacterium]|nr:hypothetical protein [Planctomycetia bacterium]
MNHAATRKRGTEYEMHSAKNSPARNTIDPTSAYVKTIAAFSAVLIESRVSAPDNTKSRQIEPPYDPFVRTSTPTRHS